MTTSFATSPMVSAQHGGEAVAERPAFAWMARVGLVARGISYAIIGILALKLAIGSGGETTNQRGALTTIAEQSLGKALLIAMTLGLASYVIWRLVRAGIGHGTQDQDSAFERIGGAASGLAYAGLCVTAVQILVGASSSGGANSPKKTTRGVLDWTGGTTIVAGVAAMAENLDAARPVGLHPDRRLAIADVAQHRTEHEIRHPPPPTSPNAPRKPARPGAASSPSDRCPAWAARSSCRRSA